MNSPKYHRYEKWMYNSISLFIVFCFAWLCIIIFTMLNIIPPSKHILSVITSLIQITLFTSLAAYVHLVIKTKKWLAEGRKLTEEIGLKRILVMNGEYKNRPSHIKVIEIHHYLGPNSEGKAFSRRNRTEVVNEFKSQLKEDYRRLAAWKRSIQNNGQQVLILMSTHPAMMKTYQNTSQPYFRIVKARTIIDKFVGMNLYEWVTASYLTTGRRDFKPPKQWDGYYFYLNEDKEMGEVFNEIQ